MKFRYELFISLRYLRAKRRRSLSLNTFVSIGGVTLGVAALIATLAVMTGFKEDLRDKILGTHSHAVITDRTSDAMTGYADVIEKIAAVPHVVAATPFIFSQVLLASEGNVHGVVLRGIDPQREGRVTDIEKNMVQGTVQALEPPAEALDPPPQPGILIGRELAGRLGAFVGDTINVITPTGKPGPMGIVPKIRRFTVAGIFDSGMYEYDSTLAYIALKTAQDFLGKGDVVTGVEVRVDDIFIAAQVAESAEKVLGFPYWARDWVQMNKNLFSALALEKMVMFVILVLIILVASFNIVSTLTMIVVEKSREIAILKAMGASRRGVMRIFMLDGLIIGLVGTAIGVPLGYAVCEVLQHIYTLPSDVYYISNLPAKIRALDVILVACSAILISFLATLYPSWQAGKLAPAEALRYE